MAKKAYAGEIRRVVILGGGFGGAYCAQSLRKSLPKGWTVTLIDRNNYLVFYPLLVEAGVGNLEPRHVVVPIRKFMGRGDFRMAEVREIDLDLQQILYQAGECEEVEWMHYDHLVLALGSVTRLPNIPGLADHGFQVKSLADGVLLRDRGIRLLELANMKESADERRALLTIIVVGSNFTGIEFAGEYQDFLRAAARSYPNLDPNDVRVMLLEYADRILPALDAELAGYARRHLERRGLEIRTKTSVRSMTPDFAELTTGEQVQTRTVVWCAGIQPNPLLMVSGLPANEQGYIRTNSDLTVEGFDNVWAIGDCAAVPSADGSLYAATAQIATRQGTVAAANIAAMVSGSPRKPFEYKAVGSLAALGCRTAVAKVFGIKLAGFPAWFLYRTIYLMKMPSWSRRVRIVLDWTTDLFFARDAVQLGLGGNGR